MPPQGPFCKMEVKRTNGGDGSNVMTEAEVREMWPRAKQPQEAGKARDDSRLEPC